MLSESAGAGPVGCSAWRGLVLLGFVLGPVFPTLVSILFRHLTNESVTSYGTAYGVMFAIGSLGSLTLAPVIGWAARRRRVQAALLIPMAIALVLGGMALVFCLLIAEVRFSG